MSGTISVVIRTYNEAEFIGRVVESLYSQKIYGGIHEIIVVDSGSTDATMDILRKSNIKILSIPQPEFNYAKALNLGIEQSSGELIVILSGHSVPCTDEWLIKIVRHFTDESVAGVYCRQIPWSDAGPNEVLRITRTFGSESRIFQGGVFCGDMNFSNAASCIRRSIWERHQFTAMPAAEDRKWAQWAMSVGYTIIYDCEAVVYHSHNDTCRKAARRVIQLEKSADAGKGRRRNFWLTIKQSAGWFLRDIKSVFFSDCFKDKRIKYSFECIARSFWYILDFSRQD
jgi:rhamnosyltransferase